MTLGTDIKAYIDTLIDDANLKSTITLVTVTETHNNFGYAAPSEGTANSSVNCIPAGYVKERIGLQEFGDLQEGEVRMLIKSGVTLDTNDRVTFNSQNFWIREIRPIYFNSVVICQSIRLARVKS